MPMKIHILIRQYTNASGTNSNEIFTLCYFNFPSTGRSQKIVSKKCPKVLFMENIFISLALKIKVRSLKNMSFLNQRQLTFFIVKMLNRYTELYSVATTVLFKQSQCEIQSVNSNSECSYIKITIIVILGPLNQPLEDCLNSIIIYGECNIVLSRASQIFAETNYRKFQKFWRC